MSWGPAPPQLLWTPWGTSRAEEVEVQPAQVRALLVLLGKDSIDALTGMLTCRALKTSPDP